MPPSTAWAPPRCPASVSGVTHVPGLNCYRCLRTVPRGFYLGGRLDVKFTNVLWPNEPFTTRGIVTSRRVENGQTRADVTVFCEKADGTKIIVASASALEGG